MMGWMELCVMNDNKSFVILVSFWFFFFVVVVFGV